MKKSLIYTRTGDAGTTSLVGGKRVAKTCARVRAYGDLDELNAHLGLLGAYASGVPGAHEERTQLLALQHTLFDIGAYLATDDADACGGLEPAHIEVLEQTIDLMESMVEEQRWFILPGGTVAAAQAHVARTVCRRVECSILALAETGVCIDPKVTAYINRLSDWLYMLARRLNALEGREETKIVFK